MKKTIFMLLLATIMFNCSSDDTENATLIGLGAL